MEEEEDVNKRTVRDASIEATAFEELNANKEFKKWWRTLTKQQRRMVRSNLHEEVKEKYIEDGFTINIEDSKTKRTYAWKAI